MGSCGCIYVGPCDGENDFENIVVRKARKMHKCYECKRIIERGEHYTIDTVCYDGRVTSYKICSDCMSVRDEFFCEGWIFGELWNDVECHVHSTRGQISGDCISKLTTRARIKLCDMIQQFWDTHKSDE